MKPRGPLMSEHRLIEKVLILANEKAKGLSSSNYDPLFMDTVVDFIKVYADRTHHGKEEDLLFKRLGKKELDRDNSRIMAELIDEHAQARAKVKEIVRLNEEYKRGNPSVVEAIKAIIYWLAEFYPRHIKKEDLVFFPDTEKYFSPDELDSLLSDFWEFDRKMIHEKYRAVYASLEG